MSTLSCSIGGLTNLQVLNASPQDTEQLEVNGQLQITIIDGSGIYLFTRGQPVTYSDSVSGIMFSGFVVNDVPQKLGPDVNNTMTLHVVTAQGGFYRLSKRTNQTNYTNEYAGDIAVDMVVNGALGQEGVTVPANIHRDTTLANFSQGILSGTSATTNDGVDGDLELTKAGSDLTITESTTSDFSTGTPTNVVASSNSLTPTTQSAVKFSAILQAHVGSDSAYLQIWSGSQVVGTLDTFNYSIWIDSSSPSKLIAVDLGFNDGTFLRTTTTAVDQNGLPAASSSDLSNYAVGQWYTRAISLPSSLNGKTVSSVLIATTGQSAGTYLAYVKNIYLTSAAGSPFFSTSATVTNVNPPVVASTVAYLPTQVTGSVVQVFDPANSYRISSAHSIDVVKLLRSSVVTWISTSPATSLVQLWVSYDGTNYSQCTNNAALPNFPAGSVTASLNLYFKEVFTVTTATSSSSTKPDPTQLPTLLSVSVSLISAPNPTSAKSDIVATYGTQTAWQTGTLTNTSALSNGDLIGLIARNWNDNLITNQTFTNLGGTTSQAASGGKYSITTTSEGQSNFDFAGQPADFTLDIDVTTPASTNGGVSVYYRSPIKSGAPTGYSVGFGFAAGGILLDGPSSQIGAYSFTLATNTTYHLKIVVSGAMHQVYFNGATIPQIVVNDNSIVTPGYIGVLVTSVSGTQTGSFDNFTINPAAASGTWQSAPTSISSLVTCGLSAISWTEVNTVNQVNSSILIQTSVDGGSTFQTCTNGGSVPNIPSGTNVSGKSVIIKATITGFSQPVAPILRQLVLRVLGAYPGASGTRSTAPMVIDTLARGNVSGSWGTSNDGQTITFNGTGTRNLTSNEGLISNTTGDVHAMYGSRTGTNLDGTVRFALSASTISAGIELRYVDSSNYYRLLISTTNMSIVQLRAGTSITLASVSVSLSVNTFYYLRFRVTGAAPTVSLFGKVWQDGTAEPSGTWAATAVSSSYVTRVFGGTINVPSLVIASGGFALFANGTGTASFDHFRVTSYPDPALSLAPVLPRLGSSNVAWNSNVPANTTLAVKTSLDGINWSTTTSGSPIPGLNGQPDPTIDIFDADSSANYTNTCKSGGGVATVTYDTINKRLTLAGGSSGVYLNSSISASDIDVICDMDESDNGGLVWRFVDVNNYYELGAYDDSSSSGFTNTLRLYKVATGTRSLLGSSAISWPRSTVGSSPNKRFRVTMLGSAITVYFDGTSMITYTDGSPLGAGKAGLRNDGGVSRYYQLRIQQQGDYVSGTPAGDVVTADFAYTQATLTTSDPSVTPQLLDLTTSARSPQIATGALIPQLHDPSKTFATPYNKEVDTIAQASGDFYWGVGPDAYGNPASLTFAGRQATPAPFCLHSSDVKFSPTGPQTSIVTPTFAADLFRNRQTIYNVTGVTGTITETKIADGSATSWTLAYPVYSMSAISVQGVVQSVGVKSVDSGKQMYWQANNNTITQDSGATKIPSGYVISVTYVGQFNTSVTEDSLPSQAARAQIETGTSGIIEASEDGQGMLASAATTYAQGLLNRYSNNDAVQLVTTTTRAGLAKGMILPVFMSEHKLNNRQLLITQIVTTAEQQGDGNVLYYYTITATDGPNLSNWAAALGF